MNRIILERLKVRNFATYRDSSIDFSSLDYPVFIVGDNGAGKTTFFVDAVTFALYGAAYGFSRIRKELITSYHDENITAEVELTLSHGGRLYRLIRRSGRVSEHILQVKESPEESPKVYTKKDDVDKAIHESLGLDYKNMMETFIARQGSLTSFIDLKPSDRRSRLIDLLNINFKPIRDKINRELIKLRNDINRYEGERSRIEEVFKREGFEKVSEDDVINRINDIEKRINFHKKRYRELESIYKEIDLEKDKLNKIKISIENIKEDIKNTEDKYKNLLNILYQYFKDNIRQEDIHNIYSKIEAIANQLKPNSERLSMFREIFDKVKDIKRQYEEYNKYNREYYEKLHDIENKYNELIFKQNYYNEKIKDLEESLKLLNKDISKCPLCGRELTEEHRLEIIRKIKNDINIFKANLNEISRRLNNLKSLLDRKRILEKKINILEGRIEESLKEINKRAKELNIEYEINRDNLNRVIEYIESSIENIEIFINSLSGELGRYLKIDIKSKLDLENMLNSIGNYVKDFKYYRDRLNELKDKMNRVLEKYNISSLEKIIEKINELDSKYESIRRELEDIREDIGRLEESKNLLIKMREDAIKYREIIEKVDRLGKETKFLDILSNQVFIESGFPLYYLEILVNRVLTEYVNKYLGKIYPDLQANYKAGKKGIELEVYMNGRRRDLNTLSGGEKTILGIATRLGLGELLTRIHSMRTRPGFLIIDEGFGPLDEDNRLKISEVFKRLVDEGLYPQVIIISHEREMVNSNYFNSIIEVSKIDDISRIEVVAWGFKP